MKVTKSQLQKWFILFNQLYFNNELPMVVITTNNRCTKRLGQCNVIKRQIDITTTYDREEKWYKETLIHEMLHLYTYVKYNYLGHSKYFKTIANRLNSQYGWHISTYANLVANENIKPIKRSREKSHYRLFEMKEGNRTFVCIIGDNFPTSILDYFTNQRNASVWYVDQNNPYLKGFRVRRKKLRGKYLANDSEELSNIKSAII